MASKTTINPATTAAAAAMPTISGSLPPLLAPPSVLCGGWGVGLPLAWALASAKGCSVALAAARASSRVPFQARALVALSVLRFAPAPAPVVLAALVAKIGNVGRTVFCACAVARPLPAALSFAPAPVVVVVAAAVVTLLLVRFEAPAPTQPETKRTQICCRCE